MIKELIIKYLEYITQDHHKRRDMDFSIEKRWNSGNFMGYRVVHDGYCHEHISKWHKNYAEAEKDLEIILKQWIKEESERDYD